MVLDPLSPAVLMFVMGAAWHGNDQQDAVAWADASLRVMPENPTIQVLAGYVFVVTGQRDRGLALLDQAATSTEASFFQVMPRMLGLALRGEPLPPLPELFRPVVSKDPHGSHMLAEIYAAAGHAAGRRGVRDVDGGGSRQSGARARLGVR
jgi:hypothetical protein